MNSIIVMMIMNLYLYFMLSNQKKVYLIMNMKVIKFKLDNDYLISNAISNIKSLFSQKKFEDMINYLNYNYKNVYIIYIVFDG